MAIPQSTKNSKTQNQVPIDVHPHSTKNSTSKGSSIDSKLQTLSPNTQNIGRPPATTTNSSGKSFNFDQNAVQKQQQQMQASKQTNQKMFSLVDERSPTAQEQRKLQQ
mmetsp:Transcript_13943/g.11921  ORF Transcript_13943/g.11921 Transcript_13943/m.11921 type:complete len:108 (-) Transcript_13943:998-1321(-)